MGRLFMGKILKAFLFLSSMSVCFLLGVNWTGLQERISRTKNYQPSTTLSVVHPTLQVQDGKTPASHPEKKDTRNTSQVQNGSIPASHPDKQNARNVSQAQNGSVPNNHPEKQETRNVIQVQNNLTLGDHPDMQYMRKYGRTKGLPTEEEMKSMSKKELTHIYHGYLDNTDYICERKIRMGKTGDGGWEVCDDYGFRPIPPCLVYSFGINDDFSFDDDVGKLYRCKVFSFDPSMKETSYTRSPNVQFLTMGLSGKGGVVARRDNGWKLETLTKIKAMLGHQNTTIDILKMDIEYSEWPALEDMLENGELNHIRQFLIEFHTLRQDSEEIYRKRLHFLAQIEALGFRRYNTHKNPWGHALVGEYPVVRVSAMEVYFVNIKFQRHKTETPE